MAKLQQTHDWLVTEAMCSLADALGMEEGEATALDFFDGPKPAEVPDEIWQAALKVRDAINDLCGLYHDQWDCGAAPWEHPTEGQ